ncbi:hypothetical protein VP1G_11404 [Cytospora mali]|uniref:Uncharacterized protein n=1 Tax=Cytospora mali TaxID=578113 RepID=A0A194VD38_CYTMA|nr:hypothetical protein VP1G_11404 [Valsa mali var. pyri (nom. inval.)]
MTKTSPMSGGTRVRTSSSLAPELSSTESSHLFHDQAHPSPSKRVRLEDPRNNYPSIPWLTESWLAKVVPYERIATASPRLGVGIIRQGLLDHYINLLPNITGFADLMPVSDSSGQHLGHRVKVATWPLTKQDELKARKFAA